MCRECPVNVDCLAEALNNPVPYTGNHSIPIDIDVQGNRQFRSRANRLQLATAYEILVRKLISL